MVELVRIPLDQSEIHSIVIRMAACALLARARRDAIRSMQSALLCYSRSNVRMAANAFELWLTAAQLVTFRAVSCSIEKLMLSRQWPRRNLRGRNARQQDQSKQEEYIL